MEKCMVCGSDDLMNFSDSSQCQRCGATGGEDGWEYNPDDVEEHIEQYDRYHDE